MSSAVLLQQEVAPENARWRGSHMTSPLRIRTKFWRNGGNYPASQFCATNVALEATICEESLAGELTTRQSGSSSVSR